MKRNIIQFMVITAMATAMLASCNKNKTEVNAPENGFRATVEGNPGNSGRTHLDGTSVLWNAEDQIKVRNGNGDVATYTLTDGEGTTSGTFYSGEDGGDFFQPTYTAIYPAAEGNTVTGYGTATFTLPATQSYVANSFANGALPMMAVSDDQTLAFKNMLGGICFPLVGDNVTVTSLVLTSNNASDNLSGVFAANYNNGEPTLSCTTGGGNSITLDCGEGVTLNASTATDFIIMVPPASLASGFTVTPYNGETAYEELSTTNNPFITRSVIKKVSTSLTVEEAVVTPAVPTGAINGKFTINNSGNKVYFSQGNLQYIGSAATPYWKFADNQWGYLGDNGQGSDSPTADRDLFGWGTSGINDYTPIATCWQPWSTSTNYTQYNPYGSTNNNLNSSSGKADWGYNAISNGGNQAGNVVGRIAWRTLTKDEWGYLFNTRKVTVGGEEKVPYGEGVVNGKNGMILLPDNWDGSVCSGFTYGTSSWSNSFSESTEPKWSEMEAAGCVFLPAAGLRNGTSVSTVGNVGLYWSSTFAYGPYVYCLYFYSSFFNPQHTSYQNYYGFSVRLVCPAE